MCVPPSGFIEKCVTFARSYIDRQIGNYASVMKRYIVLLTALVISHFAMAQDFKPMEHNGSVMT